MFLLHEWEGALLTTWEAPLKINNNNNIFKKRFWTSQQQTSQLDFTQPTFSNIMDSTTSFTNVQKHSRQELGIKVDLWSCCVCSMWLHTDLGKKWTPDLRCSKPHAAKMVCVASLAISLNASTPAKANNFK